MVVLAHVQPERSTSQPEYFFIFQVQRSLAAPAKGITEYDVLPKAAPPVPTLSRALALVLSTAESKENEASDHPNNGSEEHTENRRPAGTTQRCVAGTIPAMGKNGYVEIVQQKHFSLRAANKTAVLFTD